MPCTYFSAGEEAAMAQQEAANLAKEINRLTAYLCTAMRKINGGKVSPEDMQALQAWYTAHKERDKERLAKEALAKVRLLLSDEELESLGLNYE